MVPVAEEQIFTQCIQVMWAPVTSGMVSTGYADFPIQVDAAYWRGAAEAHITLLDYASATATPIAAIAFGTPAVYGAASVVPSPSATTTATNQTVLSAFFGAVGAAQPAGWSTVNSPLILDEYDATETPAVSGNGGFFITGHVVQPTIAASPVQSAT